MVTADVIPKYLSERGLLVSPDRADVRELGGGISNLVWMVESGEQRMVVKQSLGELRVEDDWHSDRARILREAKAIRALRPVLGDAVPEVLYIDRPRYLYVMTAAPSGSVTWKDQLLDGTVDLEVARQAGSLLASISTARLDDDRDSGIGEDLAHLFSDRTVFDELRIRPYYRTTAERVPEVSAEIEDLINDSLQIRTGLVHGDYSPKNMLVCASRIFLIDFEVVHWGDPAFDAGFLLSHLFLKAFHQPPIAADYFEAARQFRETLLARLNLESGAEREYERMTIRHLGALMLARIEGKSPVEYILEDETKERVRRVAMRMLREHPQNLEEAAALATANAND